MKECFDAVTSDTNANANAAQAMALMDIDMTGGDSSSAVQYMLSILKESFDEMAIESKVSMSYTYNCVIAPQSVDILTCHRLHISIHILRCTQIALQHIAIALYTA
jgi:hypothetical protein